jgi:hypothetical protein
LGCEALSFLDAYSGYHQIMTKESDQPWPLLSPHSGPTTT